MTPNPSESARLALACLAAETIGPVEMPAPVALESHQSGVGGPALPQWLAQDHRLLGWITGQDALLEGWLNLDPKRVFYGFVTETVHGVTAIIRGTQNFAEWGIDSEAIPERTAAAQGQVETGFWSLYRTLEFRDLDGVDKPLLEGFTAAQVTTVTGHSLGAGLATYLTLELAERFGSAAVRGRFIASPRPGDADFAAYFASKVTDYADYHYEKDLVGDVPPAWMGFAPLRNIITIPANAAIPDNPGSWHHAGNYAWELDPTALNLLPPGERAAYPR